MNRISSSGCLHHSLSAIAVLALLFFISKPCGAEQKQGGLSSPKERHQQGERMYREGVLPSGEPMEAVVKGDIPVAGTVFTCVSCHLRAGFGSFEGGVFTPPTTGNYLYKPPPVLSQNKYTKTLPRRPAYNDKTLAAALWGGVDPAGRVLDYVMPRYHLHDEDMAILIEYLKNLSAQYSQGVTDTTIHLATVITDDVNPDDGELMFASLGKYLLHKNNMVAAFLKDPRKRRMAEGMLISSEVAMKKLKLSRWLLKGAPETWQSQLEEYNRREPVFALVGGISTADWQPIHRFSEEQQIPSIFPLTDYPAISDQDWYTLYFSKGLYQEGEAAARYLNGKQHDLQGGPVVQLVSDSRQGRELANGFERTWSELGGIVPILVKLQSNKQLRKEQLQKVLEREKPSALIFWGYFEEVADLESLYSSSYRPLQLVVSGSQLKEHLLELPEKMRDYTYVTYPFRLPQDERAYAPYTDNMLKLLKVQGETGERIVKHSYAVNQVLSQALMELKGNYYRDNLLDVIGMGMNNGEMGLLQEQTYPLYERLSFGPGQRYASKGCYIVQVGKGAKPDLIKKSDWVIH